VQPSERGAGRADDRTLDLARAARLDQLPGDCAEQRLRDRGGAHRPQAANAAQRLGEQRVAREPMEEIGVVVVEPERESHVVDARVALGRNHDRPVGPLKRMHRFEPVADPQRRAVGPVDDDAGRVGRKAARLAEGVWPGRAELGADVHPPIVGLR
jgi:hypothetical protein